MVLSPPVEPVSISRVVFITEEGRGGIEFKPAGGASAMISDSQMEIPERKVSVADGWYLGDI